MSSKLREANVGNPIGIANEKHGGIYRCTFDELKDCVRQGHGFVEDFAVINGICVWSKDEDDDGNVSK